MIKEIKVFSRFHMDTIARGFVYPPSDYWYLISIYGQTFTPLIGFQRFATKESILEMGCQNYISLQFTDITKEQYEKEPIEGRNYWTLFDNKHAEKIITFLDAIHKDPKDAMLVVHCHAGVSRSGAIATFASEYLGVEFYDPYVKPNEWVLKLLNEVASKS